MAVQYLDRSGFRITAVKTTDTPRYGVCADGYSKRLGAPTDRMVKINNSGPWRRVMCWQFSNAGSLFVRIAGQEYVISRYDLDI